MRKGLYVLPSLFTVGNLSAGFYSVISSVNYNFPTAAWSIIAALVLDILDGRIARWTNMDSRFGIELDSLADLVSFGIAPAVLMYQLVLKSWGKPGLIVALIFVIAGAFRLARFNVRTQDDNLANYLYFSGLPIPAGASLLASFVILYEMFEQEITYKTIPLLMNRMPVLIKFIPLVMLILSYLMVSNLRYTSFKRMKLRRRKSLQTLVLIIITLMLVIAYPQNSIFIIFVSYVLSGIGDYIIRFYHFRRLGKIRASRES